MKKIYLLIFTLALILAACGVQATPLATVPPVPEATQPLAVNTPAGVSTEAPAPAVTEPASAPGGVTYRIVAGESRLQYEVGEVFLNQNNAFNLAVGVTTQINGDILVDLAQPQASSLGPIVVDISQFKSDSNRRDNALRDRFLESSRYPEVTFVAREINGLPDTYQEGQVISIQISGDLTIREVTKAVTFEATVKLEANALTGQATTTILMSDFGFGPIDIIGILKTEDEAKVTLSFVARP